MSFLTEKKVILTIFGIVLLYVSLTIYSDIEKIFNIFQEIQIIYLIPIFTITLFSMFLRSIIQRFLLKSLGITISLKESFLLFVSGLSMVVTPGGAGLLIKSHYIKKIHGHAIPKSSPLIIAERFHDLLGDVVVILFTLLLIFSFESLIITIISISFLIVLFIIIKNPNSEKIFKSIIRKIKFLKKIFPEENEFYSSLNKLFELKIVLLVGLSVIGLTFLEGFVFYSGFLALNTDLGYFKSIQVFYTSILYGAITFIPGGVGLTEGSFIALLTKQKIEIARATSIIILIRLTTIWFLTALGYITSFFLLRKH